MESDDLSGPVSRRGTAPSLCWGAGSEIVSLDVVELASRARALLRGAQRVIIGIAGVPGAGKSTLAEQLAAELAAHDAIVVPLDGFHLGSRLLRGTPLAARKGAMDTFDVEGYRVLLERLRNQRSETIFAPLYVRELEEPIAASLAVHPDARIIITEGNYLLISDPPWKRIRDLIDVIWYLETDDDVRLPRLIDRHIRFGKSPAEAEAWARGSDEVNAEYVRSFRPLADLIINASGC